MRIIFCGSPEEVIAPLEHLFTACNSDLRNSQLELLGTISQPARPVGRGGKTEDPPVARWAKSHGVLCFQPLSSREPQFLEELRQLKPDVIVTAAYGQILNSEFLAIPSRATINIHPSRLPAYRGATPVPAALLDHCTETAVTILFTVKKLDAGPIILSKDFAIGEFETSGALTRRLFLESGPLLINALSILKDPAFVGQTQDESKVTFCKKIEKEDGGINWALPAKTIYARFKAFEPWPGSWTTLDGRRIVVTEMKLSEKVEPSAHGRFEWSKPSKALTVSTGEGSIDIVKLKPAGGKEMDAASFWNGLKKKDSPQFGEAAP